MSTNNMNGYYIEETVKFENLKSYIIFFPMELR